MNTLKINFLTNSILLVLYCTLTKAVLIELIESEVPEIQACYDMMKTYFESIDDSLETCAKHAVKKLLLYDIPNADKYVIKYLRSFKDKELVSISGKIRKVKKFCEETTQGDPEGLSVCLLQLKPFDVNENDLMEKTLYNHKQGTDKEYDNVNIYGSKHFRFKYLDEIERHISIKRTSANDKDYSSPKNFCNWIVNEEHDEGSSSTAHDVDS